MQYKNILLLRTDRIGDVVLTTPAISLLKSEYPTAKIYFLTRAYTAPLLRHHNNIHEILIYQPEGKHKGFWGHLKLAEQLREKKIDAAFLFYPKAILAFTLWLTRIATRVGTGYRWYSIFLNHKIFEHRKKSEKHELEYNLSLLKPFLSKNYKPDEIHFDFNISEKLTSLKENILSEHKISQPYVIVHPGSGGSAPNLPPDIFKQITKYLIEVKRLQIFLVGSTTEKNLIDRIYSPKWAPKCHKIVGSWDLENYLAIISGCSLFISNSTGPLHIARALNRKIISFYCNQVPFTPVRWGPYNWSDSVITAPDNICKAKHRENCLNSVNWETIQRKLEEIL